MATAHAMESDCSSISVSSSKESSSDGEILEQSSVIVPYIDEPLAEKNGLSSATLAKRYDKDVPVSTW